MTFGKLDLLIADCERHLDATGMKGTEIESYFVQFLLTRICAEYESRITLLVQRRCSRMRDPHVKKFASSSARNTCKYFSIGEIKGILGRFGDDYKQAFHDRIVNKPPHVAWDNIYTNRQGVAHGGGAQMSFGDLKNDFRDSLLVLDSLSAALNMRGKELHDLK